MIIDLTTYTTPADAGTPRITLHDATLGRMIRSARMRRGYRLIQMPPRGIFFDAASLARVERGERGVEYHMVLRLARVLAAPELAKYATELVLQTLAFGPEAA